MRRVDSLEKIDAGRDWGQEEKGTIGWDGWMASPTRWTWVWVNSGSWWRTGRPGDSWGHKELDTTEWLNWTELKEQIKTHRIHIKKKFRKARGFKFTYILTVNYVPTPYSSNPSAEIKSKFNGKEMYTEKEKTGEKNEWKVIFTARETCEIQICWRICEMS